MSITNRYTLSVLVGLFLVVTSNPGIAAEAENDLVFAMHEAQKNRLMHPSNSQLKREKKLKVYTYVGMKDKEVDQAVNENFSRMENFLFAAVIVTDDDGIPLHENGEIVTESDGC